ncbi:hypothetical protein ACVWXU_001367 [Streptomyces sp. TE33382]
MHEPSLTSRKAALPPFPVRSPCGARIRSPPVHHACDCEDLHGQPHPAQRLRDLFGPVLQLAGRHSPLRRVLRQHRPGTHRPRRCQRHREVHPAAPPGGPAASLPGVGDGRRNTRLPAAEHHPRHDPPRRPGPGHRRAAVRTERHRGGRRGRGALRGHRRRLGRGGAGPGDPGLTRARRCRAGPDRGRDVRRRDRTPGPGRAPAGAPRRSAARRTDQQPRPVRTAPAVRGRRLLALRCAGRRQPRP